MLAAPDHKVPAATAQLRPEPGAADSSQQQCTDAVRILGLLQGLRIAGDLYATPKRADRLLVNLCQFGALCCCCCCGGYGGKQLLQLGDDIGVIAQAARKFEEFHVVTEHL